MKRVGLPQAACVVVAIKVLLMVLGFARVLRLLEWRVRRSPVNAEPERPAVEGVAHAVVAAAIVVPARVECLEQSLALWFLLRRRGVGAELAFGVRQFPFGAHAWVTYRGEPVNEDVDALRQYAVFA